MADSPESQWIGELAVEGESQFAAGLGAAGTRLNSVIGKQSADAGGEEAAVLDSQSSVAA